MGLPGAPLRNGLTSCCTLVSHFRKSSTLTRTGWPSVSTPGFKTGSATLSRLGMPNASSRHSSRSTTHSKKQIRQIADSTRRFGFTNPVLIGKDGEIIGHGRVEAAKLIGLESVPTVRLAHLDAAQRRAYVLADNKLALNAGWDQELLAIELQGLMALDFDIEVTGFSSAEIDLVLDDAREAAADGPAHVEAEDEVLFRPGDPASAITRPGDVWCLDRHRLICGDARDHDVFERLMGNERADLIFTNPPYNVPIDGHATG